MDKQDGFGAGTGIFFFTLGLFFFAVNDALGKWLVADYPVGQIILLRSCGAALFLVPMLMRDRAGLAIPDQWHLHLLRVLCMVVDSYAFYYATKALPLADVMTFYLAAPLIITALSIAILGERVGGARWAAVIVGFLGVMVALQPTSASFSPSALIALFGSVAFATAIIITRKLRDTHWLTLIGWQFLGAGLIGAISSSLEWVPPNPRDAGLMALVGIVSMLCFVSINRSLKLARASLLAPFHYTSIIWAVALGWMVWGDLPSPSMWLGIAIIVASGLFIWYREQAVAR